MKMIKKTVVQLHDFDSIEIEAGDSGKTVTVAVDPDRNSSNGLIITIRQEPNTIIAEMPNGDIEEPYLAVPNAGDPPTVLNTFDNLTIFLG